MVSYAMISYAMISVRMWKMEVGRDNGLMVILLGVRPPQKPGHKLWEQGQCFVGIVGIGSVLCWNCGG